MYWVGLVILSIATGYQVGQSAGWMVLGAGMVLFPVLRALFRRIPVQRSK